MSRSLRPPASSQRMAATANCAPSRKRRSSTISHTGSASVSSREVTVPIDQMVQAARSGKQNILEGSQASGTSKETEIKLLNVARASLEELLEDYRDFLRVRRAPIWAKDSREALFVRRLGAQHNTSYESYRTYVESRPPEILANIALCLIHQANYLLDQQIRQLEQAFLAEGGLRERMTRSRLAARERQA